MKILNNKYSNENQKVLVVDQYVKAEKTKSANERKTATNFHIY